MLSAFPASDDPVRISVSYIGYENRKIDFPVLERDTMLTLFLQTNASIGEVVVTGNERSLRSPVHSVQMGALEVNQATIRATPTLLGESDIIRTLQLMPGVSMPVRARGECRREPVPDRRKSGLPA